MNTAQDTPWVEEESLGQMVPQDMDFSNLLDLGDIDVNDFSLPGPSEQNPQYAVQPSDAPFGGTAAHDFASTGWDMAMDMDTTQPMASHPGSQEHLQGFHQTMDPHAWNGTPQQHTSHMEGPVGNMVYTHPQQIPPTPNSYELHGGDPLHMNKATMARQRQAFMNQQPQHQLRLNPANRDTFTPLVSPAVTPQDSVFQRPHDFTVPGAYFSPLSSPALQAQNGGQHYRIGHASNQPSTAGTSAATSPNSNDFDMPGFGADSAVSIPDRSRKNSRKSNASRSIVSRSGVRQSPVTKPQKRKSAALSTAMSSQDLDSLLQDAQAQQSHATLAVGTNSTDSSGGGSISPEPLTEALMGPPPRPGTSSTQQSPTLYGQVPNQQQVRFKNLSGAPATPASLMSIDNPRQQGSQTPLASSGHTHPLANVDAVPLDDFVLPPSATGNSVSTMPGFDSSNNTPRTTASRKTPKLTPLSTATTGRSMSATSSPAISAMVPSPSGAAASQIGKDSRARSSKKRSSVSAGSSIVSPALRPKISPSIKPLLPEGSVLNDSQHAFLLASKSNYTHLLEGTLLPGVSYPESLSSGLTSKRTSHKIAEQGRRNRINEALKEMQALLPPPALRAKSKSDGAESPDGKDQTTADEDQDNAGDQADGAKAATGKKDKSGKQSKESAKAASAAAEAKAANSKAATVESAIEYIRALQQERLIMAEAMKARDNEVNELRRRLRDVELKLGTANSTSPEASATASNPS
ncbi:hypothetical protein K461DRAFT_276026 [Myriangium duriaei CBS 260.36]|uniref:BHLH domain-containing protein n=1 Tax=Myriangium duriaei CBS 260.36 TaxID=1168546 RepID=A0A9P4J7I3_9PEZI|nr:hypothetical protein K461DRAFT_276026 [Myriangium duriaei CBS 260.36]